MVCRACHAGLVGGKCMLQCVVYTMCYTVCGDRYIGKTQRPVRERFQEHYREAKALVVKTPWGLYYHHGHREEVKLTTFKPFHQAQMLGRESSLPT